MDPLYDRFIIECAEGTRIAYDKCGARTIENSEETLTPEACSAEMIKLLYGYLPGDWQEDPDTEIVRN